MDLSRGATLALLGVVLFSVTMAVSAATAPSRNVVVDQPTPTATQTDTAGTATAGGTATGATPIDGTATDGTATDGTPTDGTATPAGPRTLVGMQGSWTKYGSVFLVSGTEEVWREGSADGYFEVSRLDDGTVLAAFANEKSTDCGDLPSPCARTGFRHIDPSGPDGPTVVAEYSFPVKTLTNSEVHAVDRITEGTYVFTDMDQERIAIVDNGTEVWEWRASSFYDAPPDPTSRDWLHINDVDAIDENRFLVSVRNANQLVVVERGSGVVEVINEDTTDGNDDVCTKKRQLKDFDGDGEVRCGDLSVINHQHNPQWLGPGAVLVADSDNDRIVELHRSADGDWEPVWTLESAGGIDLHWPRDADRLPNGHTLVTDSLRRRVFEIDTDGDVVWSISTERIPYEADRLPMGEFAGRYEAASTSTDTQSTTGGTVMPGDSTPGDSTATDRRSLPTVAGDGSVDAGDTGSGIPGLSIAVVGLRGQFSWIPFWFGELHLAVAIVSLLFVVGGSVDYWRTETDRSILSPLSRLFDRQ